MGCCTDNGISIVIQVFPISFRLEKKKKFEDDGLPKVFGGEIAIKCHVIHMFSFTQR